MTIATKIIFIAALILSIIIPFGYYLIGEKNKKRYKRTIGINAFFFFGAFAIASIAMLAGPDSVHAATAAANGATLATGMGYLAAALVTGLSCIGGGIAVASAASAALGAISEDSSVLGKSLIFVGLAEGVCLYGLIISFMILADKTVGIVLLTEKLGREFPDLIDTFRLERKMPLLVEIPDRHGTGRKKDFITSYITEAIGLKL